MSKELKETMFGGEKAGAQNALMSALWELAGSKEGIYDYLDTTPKTTLIVEIVDQLEELGYSIAKITNKTNE